MWSDVKYHSTNKPNILLLVKMVVIVFMFLEVTGFDCGGAATLKIIKFIFQLLELVSLLIPICLILMLSIDFAKSVIANKDSDMKKSFMLAMKRFIFCIIVFLISPVVQFSVNLLGDNNLTYIECIEIALNEDLSQYEIEFEEDDYSNVITPDFNRNPEYSVVEKDDDSSDSATQLDIKDKKDLVAIMYTTWFNKILPSNPQIISNTSNYAKNKYYFWGEPEVGFYKSTDKSVIKKHMKQLASAGIDFIIIDNTNAVPNWISNEEWNGYVTEPLTALLDTIVEMRKNGENTPYVVNWVYTGNQASGGNVPFITWNSVNHLYDEFYTKEKYKNAWVYWNGKPFIITTSTPTSSTSKSITTRSMWGLSGVSSVNWSYLEKNNDKPGKDANGNIEQIGVSTAMQSNYMSNTSSATGRNGGLTFYNQWKTAFKYHPKIVTITWWNEWGAVNLGNGTFTDLYNQEYSRDIEPMKGGHGDTYYQWMKQYIKAYKANESCPKLTN